MSRAECRRVETSAATTWPTPVVAAGVSRLCAQRGLAALCTAGSRRSVHSGVSRRLDVCLSCVMKDTELEQHATAGSHGVEMLTSQALESPPHPPSEASRVCIRISRSPRPSIASRSANSTPAPTTRAAHDLRAAMYTNSCLLLPRNSRDGRRRAGEPGPYAKRRRRLVRDERYGSA